MKKPSKTAAQLEASIKVEMEDICDWPTDMMISVQPDGDSWKVKVVPATMMQIIRDFVFKRPSQVCGAAHAALSTKPLDNATLLR
jgi:hypothetical protein